MISARVMKALEWNNDLDFKMDGENDLIVTAYADRVEPLHKALAKVVAAAEKCREKRRDVLEGVDGSDGDLDHALIDMSLALRKLEAVLEGVGV